VPTVRLPADPDLDHLRRQAKQLRDAVRAGRPDALTLVERHDPPVVPAGDFPLHRAQLVVARSYGFPSWARLKRHCELVGEFSRSPDVVPERADPADEFLRLACLTYGADSPRRRDRARHLLAARPDLVTRSIHVASAAADAGAVRDLLAADPAQADALGGPFGWTPLCYLAYARHDPDVTEAATLDTARALLAAGADANAGFLWHGLPTPFTVLTGVFGEGEGGPASQPAHPHATALAGLLLAAGADPNDGQVLYNRMFAADDSHLELLLRHGLGRGRGGVWHRRLGPALDSPAELAAALLRWAVTHDQEQRVRLLVRYGTYPLLADDRGYSAARLAAIFAPHRMVDLLGVPPMSLDAADALVAAVFAGDGAAVAAAGPAARRDARRRYPGVLVWAAARRRGDAAALLLELGWGVDDLGRGDAIAEGAWETALHQAAGNGDHELVRLLLAAGADRSITDQRFDATAQQWAEHFGQLSTAQLLRG
jgi:ankyrin repeat protein